MKKLLSIIFLCLTVQSVFALKYYSFGNILAGNECIRWEESKHKIARENLYVGKDGWYHFNDKLIIFQASGFERFSHATALNYSYSVDTRNYLDYKILTSKWNEPENYPVPEVSFFASSYLSEKINGETISYTPDSLSNYMKEIPVYEYYGIDYAEFKETGIWDYSHIPWVEGKNDYGIGESITAKFSEQINSFSILNGYVDPLHPDYYKKNSRVKKLKVTDIEKNLVYYFDLEDVVIEQRFCLKEPAQNLKFEIADVYKGEKYQDTCITGLFGHTYPNAIYISYDDDEGKYYDPVDYLQQVYFNRQMISWCEDTDYEVQNISAKEDRIWRNNVDYYVREVDENILYEEIIEYCKKKGYQEIEPVDLYKDDSLYIYLKWRGEVTFETKKEVSSIDYKFKSSIPMFNDSDRITDIPTRTNKEIEFKGFYENTFCYYHFITDFSLTFNFADGTSFTYKPSEQELKSFIKHFDISAWIQYIH